ncbi:ribosome-associated heat shock protein Hsp15 [Natronospirillum operosum]|uniref:Heat shock protein 15 n=1 Tax=Natronospirillum operosum TaxID=2759953 RepID=A0A4Z0WC84_9GAMM|nr:ribosome-associated heat shock protein Hsp15 [Natronospirillum operosum]TGG91363.1 ribosome-associated heat shock protein Hsp15 [Natronospirillum operosum]
MTSSTTAEAVRLDKWLWAARFYKTRGLAKSAVEGGKVHYNGARAKPSRAVEIGAELRLRLGFEERTVAVLALSERRGPAREAQQLYAETPESIERRERNAELRRHSRLAQVTPEQKPSKKQRRDLQRMKNQALDQ